MLKRGLRVLSVLLLVPSVLWLFSNAVVNQHNHKLQNGEIITHSHPYTPDSNNHTPFQSHGHSAFVILIANQVANLSVTVSLLLCLIAILYWRTHYYTEYHYLFVPQKSYINSYSFRGPPSVL